MNDPDRAADPRMVAERRRLEAVQRRDEALLEQRSLGHSPAVRVRLWEALHQLRLPKDPAHGILALVAEQTGLQLEQVRQVQRERQLVTRL